MKAARIVALTVATLAAIPLALQGLEIVAKVCSSMVRANAYAEEEFEKEWAKYQAENATDHEQGE